MRINANNYEAKDSLRMIREWTGLTQKEFAKIIGVSETTIQNYEQGLRNFTFLKLLEICKKTNVQITITKEK